MATPSEAEIYCFKCREKTTSQEVQEVVLKNGSPAVTGRCTVCTVCGTRQFRMTSVRK